MADGKFRSKKVNFTQVSNIILRNKKVSLKAKGLYSLIQSYITLENFMLYKSHLRSMCAEGEKAFEGAWNELKSLGYLKMYKIRSAKEGFFIYEYELLDEPDLARPSLITIGIDGKIVDPQKVGSTKNTGFKIGCSNNTNNAYTDTNNTENNNNMTEKEKKAVVVDKKICEEKNNKSAKSKLAAYKKTFDDSELYEFNDIVAETLLRWDQYNLENYPLSQHVAEIIVMTAGRDIARITQALACISKMCARNNVENLSGALIRAIEECWEG